MESTKPQGPFLHTEVPPAATATVLSKCKCCQEQLDAMSQLHGAVPVSTGLTAGLAPLHRSHTWHQMPGWWPGGHTADWPRPRLELVRGEQYFEVEININSSSSHLTNGTGHRALHVSMENSQGFPWAWRERFHDHEIKTVYLETLSSNINLCCLTRCAPL